MMLSNISTAFMDILWCCLRMYNCGMPSHYAPHFRLGRHRKWILWAALRCSMLDVVIIYLWILIAKHGLKVIYDLCAFILIVTRWFLNLHENYVPRYLFRTWSPSSGSRFTKTINSKTEIAPHAFVNDQREQDFLGDHGTLLVCIGEFHYSNRKNISSFFSSWTASLHLAIVYALTKGPSAHIAVMGTSKDWERCVDMASWSPDEVRQLWIPCLWTNQMGRLHRGVNDWLDEAWPTSIVQRIWRCEG